MAPKIAVISEGTEKHTIKEEHTAIDISPQSSGEETHKSSQEDETKEEGEKPIVKVSLRMKLQILLGLSHRVELKSLLFLFISRNFLLCRCVRNWRQPLWVKALKDRF